MKKEYIKPTLCFEQAEPMMMLASSRLLTTDDSMSVEVSDEEWDEEFSVKSDGFLWDE
ncbi:MAG: hypothetical protein J5486_10540 [Bacteroidaceae bacterium]|nr:hypothetical protein [Bacteroidaceae bacterium]